MTTEAELKILANSSAPTPSPYYVTVLYGDTGTRKTTTAVSLVKEKGLLLSSDDSWKVLLNDRHRELYEKVKIIQLEGLSQLRYIDFEGYDTIIWDTLSQSVDTFLDLLYDEASWSGNIREKLTTSNKELKGLETLGLADYRLTRDKLRPIFNKLFRETKAHLVITSQMKRPIPMGQNSSQQVTPAIPGATFKIVDTRADVIAQTKMNGSKSEIDVTHGVTQLGKSRIESIQGKMSQDAFIKAYKEKVFK